MALTWPVSPRNGRDSSCPFSTTLIKPPCSSTNTRPLSSPACTSPRGLDRPAHARSSSSWMRPGSKPVETDPPEAERGGPALGAATGDGGATCVGRAAETLGGGVAAVGRARGGEATAGGGGAPAGGGAGRPGG